MTKRTITIVVIVALVGFFVWLANLPFKFLKPPSGWSELAALATYLYVCITLATFILLLIAAWLASRQLEVMNDTQQMTKRTSQLESILAILRYLDDPQLRIARWFMYEHADKLKELFNEPMDWEQRWRIDRKIKELSNRKTRLQDIEVVLNALNNTAYLIQSGYAPYELVESHLKNTFLRCWYAFSPYIEYRRRNRLKLIEEPSMYAEQLEKLITRIAPHAHNQCK